MESIFLDNKTISTNKPYLKIGLFSSRPSPNPNRNMTCGGTVKFTSQVIHTMKMNSTTVRPVSSDVITDRGIGIFEYINGKNYFITGATGFLGKVLIEKMLRTATTVGKIYLLIKAEDYAAAAERLKSEIIDSELFLRLKEFHGETYEIFMMEKLLPVVGNVCEDDLGMDADIAKEIANEVDVIINSAADTSLDKRYDVALNTNTKGPCRVLKFAKVCSKLQVFVHVSTAFVNGEREGVVYENPFEIGKSIASERSNSDAEKSTIPPLDIETELSFAFRVANSNRNDSGLNQKMKDLGMERAKAHGWQSTYVFTKAMGEMLLNSMKGDIPIVIVRPSVVESIFKDPIPGWIQGNRMLDPLILSYAKGQLPGFPMDPQEIIDVVPADMVVNATLAAMTKHGKTSKPGLNIYQISSAVINPLLFDDVFSYSYSYFSNSGLINPNGDKINVEKMRYFSSADQNFSSYIQEITMQELKESLEATDDLLRPLSERTAAKWRRKVDHFFHLAKIYEPYMFCRARFDNSNTEILIGEMSVEEMHEFDFNVGKIDWEDYFMNVHIPGLRKHVLKK